MRGLIFIAAAVLIYLGIRWWIRQPPKSQWQAVAVVLGIGLVALALTGRLNWIAAIFGALLPFARRLFSLLSLVPVLQRLASQWSSARAGPASQPGAGGNSRVETDYLSVTLCHDTGEMDGTIKQGRHEGQRLSVLGREQVAALIRDYETADAESARLLIAYFQRRFDTGWEDPTPGADATAGSGEMSISEALDVLGLEEGATQKDVITAHRRLMQKLHPDRGGSTYLAAKLNQAKDVLTRHQAG